MPYIQMKRRMAIDEYVDNPRTGGELNYLITRTILNYYQETRDYQAINDILGALEGAKLEFYRRVVVPYEEKKKEGNGDVY